MRLAIITFDDIPEDQMEKFADAVEVNIKNYIRRNTKVSTGALESSIRASVAGKVILIDSESVYAKVVDKGSATKQLWNLINKAIPIKLPNGVTIIRRVTQKSLSQGKWVKKARMGINFTERGAKIALTVFPDVKGMRVLDPEKIPLTEKEL